MYELRILDAAQFRGIISMDEVIPGVEEAYSLYSSGRAGLFPIITHDFETGRRDMDIKSGYMDGAGIFGLKILGWNRDNPSTIASPALSGLIVVMDSERQQPIGIIEGGPVTFLRTGAAGAVGAKNLARPESERVTIVGAGAQGRAQLMGLTKVMGSIKSVEVFDIIDEASAKMAEETGALYPNIAVTARPFAELGDSVRRADIIVTCTVSRSAFIKKEWVKEGAHINAIGADMHGKQELEPELAASVKAFGDSRVQVADKGECQHAVALGLLMPEAITEIGDVINGTKSGRTSQKDITLFDATGMALQDLITAKITLERAAKAGIGTVIRMEQ